MTLNPMSFAASSDGYYIIVVGRITQTQLGKVQQDCLDQGYEHHLDVVGYEYRCLMDAMELGEEITDGEVPYRFRGERSYQDLYDEWATQTPCDDHLAAAVVLEERAWTDSEFVRLLRELVPPSQAGDPQHDEWPRCYWVAYPDGRIETV